MLAAASGVGNTGQALPALGSEASRLRQVGGQGAEQKNANRHDSSLPLCYLHWGVPLKSLFEKHFLCIKNVFIHLDNDDANQILFLVPCLT